MTESEILQQMGLTAGELRDLLHKTYDYYQSLNPAQKALVLSGSHSRDEAAATLRHDVSPEQLEGFLRKHGEVSDLSLRWCKLCRDADDDDEDEAAEEE